MTVRSERGVYGLFAVILIIIAALVLLYLSTGAPLLLALLFQLPPIVLSALYLLLVGRILVFDENGLTARFLWRQKTIRWEQMQTVRMLSFHGRVTYRYPYEKAVVFSAKKTPAFRRVRPSRYGLFHPASFFYVYFLPDPPLKTDALHPRYPHEYCCNEAAFLDNLRDWGVQIEQIDS